MIVAYQPQDALKHCFQAAFGAEHLLDNIGKAREYFDKEFDTIECIEHSTTSGISEDEQNLVSPLYADVCRINMAPWKRLGLNPSWLFSAFVFSAAHRNSRENSDVIFEEQTNEVIRLTAEGAFPFSLTQWQMYIREYLTECAGKLKPVRHSEEYRQREKPAYRVVSGVYARLIPIMAALAGKENAVIALDGRAASGKTTAATALAKLISGEIVHMDDFFPPQELRTKERMDTPGGNIHHERFASEVLANLKPGEPGCINEAFTYRIFDCKTMGYKGTRSLSPTPWVIVEGAYSCHPILNNYMDLRVFSDINPETQMQRIEVRNGKIIAADYAAKWIPMEEAYIKAYRIKENADVLLH